MSILDTLFSVERLGQEFTHLYSIRFAYTECRRRNIEKFQRSQAENTRKLSNSILKGTYEPKYKGHLISQTAADGSLKYRGITPLQCDDYLVQRIILKELQSRVKPDTFSSVSYGRKAEKKDADRSPIACCKAIANARVNEPWAFRADLVNFFPSIDRIALLHGIEKHIENSGPLLPLLSVIILTDAEPDVRAPLDLREKFWPSGQGAHQGSVLAPFFANIVMNDWDHEHATNFRLFRYIDDWLVLASTKEEVTEKADVLQRALPSGVCCHLDNPKKCDLYAPHEAIQFLGLHVSPNCTVGVGEDVLASFKRRLTQRREESKDILQLGRSLLHFKAGWLAYYRGDRRRKCNREILSQKVESQVNALVKREIENWFSKSKCSEKEVTKLVQLVWESRPNFPERYRQMLSNPGDVEDFDQRDPLELIDRLTDL